MTPMWMLVKDHIRRNWKTALLGTVLLSCFYLLIIYVNPLDLRADTHSHWTIFFVHSALTFLIADSVKFTLARVWRSLPLRKSSLANLAWATGVLAPPLLAILIILLIEFLKFCFGKTNSGLASWLLLFFPLAVLNSGMITLVKALGVYESFRTADSGDLPHIQTFSDWRSPILTLLVVCAGAWILYLPSPWLGLGPSHLAGMSLAAWLTWKSYQMRSWLLEPAFKQDSLTLRGPRTESPARYQKSALAALARELNRTAQSTFFSLLGLFVCIYLIGSFFTWFGLADTSGGASDFHTILVGVGALVGLGAAFDELSRISTLRLVRSLPLTTNQCIALLLSYPYTVFLAALPCVTLFLWFIGYPHILPVLIAGTLLCTSSCPFGMFIIGRFNRNASRLFQLVPIFVVIPTLIFMGKSGQSSVSWSPLTLSAATMVLAALVLTGYYGLRHLIENSSAVYKRKPSPQLFGQRLGR